MFIECFSKIQMWAKSKVDQTQGWEKKKRLANLILHEIKCETQVWQKPNAVLAESESNMRRTEICAKSILNGLQNGQIIFLTLLGLQ